MTMTWTPDFCPPGAPCTMEVSNDWATVISFQRTCLYHQSLRDGGMTDQQLFEAIVNTSKTKEVARYAAKNSLNLPKEYGGLPYTVGADGTITIDTSEFAGDKVKMQADVQKEVDKLAKKTGQALVVVV